MGKFPGLIGGWQGYGALALACFLAGSLGTWRILSWREQAGEKQAMVRTIKVIEYRNRISNEVATKFEPVRAKVVSDTNKRLNEVESHVSAKSDVACPVPIGFVRLFNDSTHGAVPGAAGGSDDAASGVELSDVAKTTVQNNGRYDGVAAQLSALQDWVRQQQAAPP